jgi:leader peptidase (prepilin peptidase)/N-methyltransferase
VEVLEAWPALLLVGAALLGLIVGSFLNVVVFRLPVMMERAWRSHEADLAAEPFTPPAHAGDGRFDLVWPPSACPSCGARIKARHNVPVLSWLLLRGRCASCSRPVSRRYPLVEAFAAGASIVVAYAFGPTWQTAAALVFTWTLISLSLIDFDHKLLPDSLTLPLLWAGLLVSLFSVDGAPLFADLRSSVIGAAAGYLSLWSVFHVFKLVTGKEGMGYGDFKLLAALGAWLGWQLLPLVILLSAAVGSVVGVALIVFQGRSRQTTIPFGPYLAAAGWLALLWGDRIMVWYLDLMR